MKVNLAIDCRKSGLLENVSQSASAINGLEPLINVLSGWRYLFVFLHSTSWLNETKNNPSMARFRLAAGGQFFCRPLSCKGSRWGCSYTTTVAKNSSPCHIRQAVLLPKGTYSSKKAMPLLPAPQLHPMQHIASSPPVNASENCFFRGVGKLAACLNLG